MYLELFATILLLLPLISAKRWHSFFKSRFLNSILGMAGYYFKILVVILIICFLDALREMNKYSIEVREKSTSDHGHHLDVDMQQHMRLFRSQRNFYISGFALVLCFVLNRLTTLISQLAISDANCEAALKQADSASAAAQQLLQRGDDDQDAGPGTKALLAKDAEIASLQEELEKMRAEHSAMTTQAEGVKREYDRLLEETSRLQAAGDKDE